MFSKFKLRLIINTHLISLVFCREMIYQESYDQLNEDPKNVKATPEFKSFVAKKLSSALDG